jgi:hypothetical protein
MRAAICRLAAHANPKADAAHRFLAVWAGNLEEAPERGRHNGAYEDRKDDSYRENSRRIPHHHTHDEKKNKGQRGISLAASYQVLAYRH